MGVHPLDEGTGNAKLPRSPDAPQTQRTGEFRLMIERKIAYRKPSQASTQGKTSGRAGRTVDTSHSTYAPRRIVRVVFYLLIALKGERVT
jgi:hypothetical protein